MRRDPLVSAAPGNQLLKAADMGKYLFLIARDDL